MNCYNHPEDAAVASCIDCGKGLCKNCTDLYQMPICSECNMKRVKVDKGSYLGVYVLSVLMLIFGFFTGMDSGVREGFTGFLVALGFAYVFAGVPWGWRRMSFQSKTILILPIFGWILYFCFKFMLSWVVGLYAMPFGIAKAVSTHKNEKNIKNNLRN